MAWEIVVKEKATTNDVCQLIVQTINDYSDSEIIKRIIALYNGVPQNNIADFTKWLFDFCCKTITYRRDPKGWERIFTPLRLMHERFGDCKKFTTLIACVLKHLGYGNSIRLKVVSYNGKDWEHIYPVLLINGSKYITLDPVNYCQYNKEVNYVKTLVYKLNGEYMEVQGNKLSQMGNVFRLSGMMQGANDFISEIDGINFGDAGRLSGGRLADVETLYELSGCNCIPQNGMGKIFKKTKEERQEKRKEIINKAKNVGMAIPRVAFLGLVALGPAMEKTTLKFNLSKKIAEAYQKNPSLIKNSWIALGGDPKTLVEAVRTASGVQISGPNEFSSNDESNPVMVAGLGIVTAAAVVTAITTATPVLLVILKTIKDAGVLTTDQVATSEATTDAAEDTYTDAGKPKITPPKSLITPNASVIKLGAEVVTKTTGRPVSLTTTPNASKTTEGSFINFKKLNDVNTHVKSLFLGILLGSAGQIYIAPFLVSFGIGGLCFAAFKNIKHKLFNSIQYGKL